MREQNLKCLEIVLPVKYSVIDAKNDNRNEPYNKGKNHQIQNVVEHHNGETVFLMVKIHSCEKRV